MDFSADPQAFDDTKSGAVPEGAADAASTPDDAKSPSQALTKFEPKAAASASEAGPERPKVESIPGSAMVILPPKKEKLGGFTAGERLGGAAGTNGSSLKTNALRAAAVLLFAGGVYAAGSHYLSAPSAPAPAHAAMAPQATTVAAVAPPAPETAAPPPAPVAEDASQLASLRHETIVLNNEVRKLQARLAALQGEPDQMRNLKKSIDGLKAGFEAEKADYKAQIAQLTAKLDHAHAAASEKARVARLDAKAIQATLDHAAQTESSDATGSIPNAAPVTLASAEAPRHAPSQALNDWVVRDVYRGIALVEGPQGAVEVMPGDTLPGAGTVRAIERRGEGWVVVTSRGYVDYERD